MRALITKIDELIDPLRTVADKIGSPILDLSIRLYMANIFWVSGKQKLDSFLNNDFESTIFLFEDVHPIPGLDPVFASYAATVGEVILPVLLALGLFGRFAAIGLLIMTITIQYIVPAEYGIANADHYFWMFLLAVTAVKGPGLLSLDKLLVKFARKDKN